MKFNYLVLGLFILIGCETSEIASNRLLVKEIVAPSYIDTFRYNDNGRLVEFERILCGKLDVSIVFQYSNNKLVKVDKQLTHGITSTIELTYNDNNLRQEEKLTTKVNGETTYKRIGNFKYENGLLKSISYTSIYSDNTSLTETEFEWSNNNISKMEFYVINNSNKNYIGNRRFTYDNKINYSNQDIAFIYTVGDGDETKVSKSNLLTQQETFGDNQSYQGEQYSFSYNVNGYPIEYTYSLGTQVFSSVQIKYQ